MLNSSPLISSFQGRSWWSIVQLIPMVSSTVLSLTHSLSLSQSPLLLPSLLLWIHQLLTIKQSSINCIYYSFWCSYCPIFGHWEPLHSCSSAFWQDLELLSWIALLLSDIIKYHSLNFLPQTWEESFLTLSPPSFIL